MGEGRFWKSYTGIREISELILYECNGFSLSNSQSLRSGKQVQSMPHLSSDLAALMDIRGNNGATQDQLFGDTEDSQRHSSWNVFGLSGKREVTFANVLCSQNFI